MEKRHKDILITQRSNLVEEINPRDGLFTQLISKKVFKPRTVRSIQHNRTPDEQVEELLNILPTRGGDAFRLFCEALKEDDQEHVLEFLKCDTPDNSDTPKEKRVSTPEKDIDTRKRPHSPLATETLCIRDKDAQNIVIKYLRQGDQSGSHGTKVPIYEEADKQYEYGEPRLTKKHWITDPDVLHIGRWVPVDCFENFMPPPASSAAPPFNLSRCDSLDAMTKSPVKSSTQPSSMSSDTIDSDAVHIAQSFDETEDAQIDLTDGPVTVKVEHCSRQFYLAFHRKSYPMQKLPRGKALIINVNEVVNKAPRRGTDIDRDNLHNLLKQLHFDVLVYNDSDGLTAESIVDKLKKFSQLPDHQDCNSAVICLLSHGEEGYIFGTDGKKIPLDEIFMMFDNTQCRGLIGKPKIFFIQACRGGALDPGVRLMKSDETDGGPVCPEPWKQLPTMSDMIICYPTQFGYYAWRNRERGSWYIEAIVQIFMRHSRNEDICTMMNRVNSLVSRKVSRCPQIEMDRMTQMSEYKSTLRMPHLFFFPGIGTGETLTRIS